MFDRFLFEIKFLFRSTKPIGKQFKRIPSQTNQTMKIGMVAKTLQQPNSHWNIAAIIQA